MQPQQVNRDIAGEVEKLKSSKGRVLYLKAADGVFLGQENSLAIADKFGEVINIISNSQQRYACVEYLHHEDALKAMEMIGSNVLYPEAKYTSIEVKTSKW